MKISSQKLFEFIVTYFNVQGFDERSLSKVHKDRVILFFESISKWYYSIDNKQFFQKMENYIIRNINEFEKSDYQRLLDLLKYN